MTRFICMWSGPRNLSTAMMRSFGSRPDCAVLDEPFFAPYLKVSGKSHPGRVETLACHETDPKIVARHCLAAPKNGAALYFQKHMPHHMLDGFPLEWAKSATHFFLIREPARVIASYVKGREGFDLSDLGFAPQRRLYETLSDLTGQDIPVVDSQDILNAPEARLKALCGAINIDFHAKMLSWEAGPRPEDGAWAPYWYKSVENSTGFGPPPSHTVALPPEYKPFLKACRADYEALFAKRIQV